jgi:hypothetical protein
MSIDDENNALDFPALVKQLKHADLSEADKLAAAFDHTTNRIIEHAQNEIELSRAKHDRDAVIKQQIKMETLKHARGIFQDCFQLVLGRRAWDE